MPQQFDSHAADLNVKVKAQREALLADISALTAMPFPNLVYRVLADEPGRLESCWYRVRAGLVLVGARRLRERLADSWLTSARSPEPQEFVSDERRRRLTDVLDAYDSGNSCNAVIVTLLLHGSRGEAESRLVQPLPVEVPSVPRPLPVMLELDEMTGATREQVVRLARMVDTKGDVVPSVFRHLAHDDVLVDTAVATLRAAFLSGAFDRLCDEIISTVATTITEWPVPVDPLTDSGTRALIEPFARAIPRMLAVSAVLRSLNWNPTDS